MTTHRISRLSGLFAALIVILTGACNKKTEDAPVQYTPSSNVAVTAFAFKAHDGIANLDSVFFAIDLREGIIFNADSLPVGSKVTSLVPVITYPSSVGAVSVKTSKGTFDYVASPGTAHDFSEPVAITLTAQDGSTKRTYTVKVNVHKQNPAQLLWSQTSLASLPGTSANPASQKTLRFKEATYCFVQNTDGTVTRSVAEDNGENWETSSLSLPFNPDLRSMAATPQKLYMLSQTGELHESADGSVWQSCNVVWESITGEYLESITGIRVENQKRIHTAYPAGTLPESAVATSFPLGGFSNCATVTTPWSPCPSLFIYGGKLADGSNSTAAWGFDGECWTVISANKGPEVTDAMLIPYWLARPTSTLWLKDDRDCWIIMGGTLPDGSLNRKVWYSFDNGVNWFEGTETLDIPGEMPGFVKADALVYLQPRSASALGWKGKPKRLHAVVEGSEILWECPEIFLFGGLQPDGTTANTIWRAVLARYTFVPII